MCGIIMKICKTCNKELELSEFYKAPHNRDGHSLYCKHCMRAKVNEKRTPATPKLVKERTLEVLEKGEQVCKTCKQLKPLDAYAFSINKGVSKHRRYRVVCKACVAHRRNLTGKTLQELVEERKNRSSYVCKSCNLEQPMHGFYDGHLKCKTCSNKVELEKRKKKREAANVKIGLDRLGPNDTIYCVDCKTFLPRGDFTPNKTKVGAYSACKLCATTRKGLEAIKAASYTYYHQNKEEILARNRLASRKAIAELSDRYVQNVVSNWFKSYGVTAVNVKELLRDQDLMEASRNIIRIRRLTRNKKLSYKGALNVEANELS